MESRQLSSGERRAVGALASDLHRVFGARLHSLVAYGMCGEPGRDEGLHTLALVDRVRFEDLAACAPSSERWRRLGLEVPLVLSRDEFQRTLDVFPLEYSDIIASHVVIEGSSPFAEARIADADRRRACELQAKSHVIHLREGFIESRGDARAVARLIGASAAAFRTLLANIARLDSQEETGSVEDVASAAERTIGIQAALVDEVLGMPLSPSTIADPTALLARYIDAAERVWAYVDGWRQR